MIVIGLDIDSTVMTHSYPGIGADLGATFWLAKALALAPDEIKFIICSMRSGNSAELAKAWLEQRGIPIWSINKHPTQEAWTSSPKPFCQIYCDDRNVGTPLREDGCVNWDLYGPMLIELVKNMLLQ